MKSPVSVVLAVALMALPVLADHNHDLRTLSHQLAGAAQHFAEMAAQTSHHGSIQEIILINRAREFARRTERFYRRVHQGVPLDELRSRVKLMEDVAAQIHITMLFSHTFEHVQHDWQAAYRLLEQVRRIVRDAGPRENARAGLFDRLHAGGEPR